MSVLQQNSLHCDSAYSENGRLPNASLEPKVMSASNSIRHRTTRIKHAIRLRSLQLLLVGALATTLLLIAAPQAKAVHYDLTVANQNWNTGTNWSPNGVPGAGDSVVVDLFINVTSSASFGNSTNNSFLSGPNAQITISPGQSLTHVAGSTLIANSPQTYFSNTGTFENYGYINNSGRFLLGYPATGSVMNNYGTFEITAANSRLELYSNGSNFYNQAGGSVVVTLPAATDKAFVLSDVAFSNAKYIHAGGNPITFNQGRLVFAPPGGVGATLDDTLFGQLFGPINANSELRLSGGINSISLTNPLTDLSRVRLGNDQQNVAELRTQPGGTSINVTVPGG